MKTAIRLFATLMFALPTASMALTFANDPLFLASTEPRVMLLLSRDHELSKKAYTDYTDLDNDGILDTTYNDEVDYYGYFDSAKCYSYSTSNNRFEPASAATGTNGHECSGAWSGNFLNWATMTRLDVVRKVLYGGFRSTDGTGTTSGTTVLERAFLPMDVHAFAKVYAPAGGATDVAKFTPYASAASVTLCNVTDVGAAVQAGSISTVNGVSTSSPPRIKVASGSWPQWAMAEILQCQWREDFSAESGGVYTRPTRATHRLTGSSDLVARTVVCAPGLLENNCKSYYTRATTPVETVKPTGLLQEYGDVDVTKRVRFGLITGSYKKNTSGGVLRKNIKLLANNAGSALSSSSICGDNDANDEVDVCTGQFLNQADADGGIIDTLNRLHIAGYKTPASGAISSTWVCAGGYNNSAPFACNSGSSSGGLFAPTDGTCVDWGNPLSEMYHEAMRYFAGKTSASTAYSNMSAEDSDATAVITGLGNATWNASSDPLPSTEWCALSNIIVLSTGLTSLDNATITTDISGLNPASLTNTVGSLEGVSGSYLIGSNGTTSDNLCSAKTLSNLSSASGICPEVPHMKGGYLISGLAYANRTLDLRPGYASLRSSRWTDINSNWVDRQPLATYAVALAENLPSFDLSVGSGTVTLVPACRSNGSTICSMTDLRVESYSSTSGSFLVSWEDNSAGSDYDMDIIERIEYCVGSACSPAVSSNQIKITVSAAQAATGAGMELGYTVTGTSADGTVFPVKLPGTATCNPTDCGSSSANRKYFSLLTSPPAYRCTNFNTATPASSYTCPVPWSTTRMPSGLVSATGCASCPSGVTCTGWGANCGCPKAGVYTQGTPAANLLKNPLWYAAKYGAQSDNWDLKNNTTGVETPDGEPDNFFHARNPADLYDALAEVFDNAAQTDSAASSVATTSSSLNEQSYIFQAKFSPIDWSGDLLAYRINSNGVLTTPAKWNAATKLDAQTATSRVIVTKGASDGVAFRWANLTTGTGSQQAMLNANYLGVTDNCGDKRLDYLRGDDTYEGDVGSFTVGSCSASKFRPRETKLGDIVNSNPWYVGPPAAGYLNANHPGYAAFRTRYSSRKPVVYAGANDGMLHGFDASIISATGEPTSSAGNEVLAYVPSQVYSNLSWLTARNYNKNHRYFVDGSPFAGDAYLSTLTGTDTDKWRTVLVGGLSSGGKGYYALDITNSGNDATVTAPTFEESSAASLLLWEFTDAHDADMGYSYNLPPQMALNGQAKQIAKMENGKWAVVVGNGYNSDNDGNSANGLTAHAVLYILFIEGGIDGTWTLGTDYLKFTVDSSGANGLSTPVPFDTDGNGLADVIYAGDLKGNLWKFDVRGSNTANWVIGTRNPSPNPSGVNGEGVALFQAKDGSGAAQPIIAPPEAVLHPSGGILVLFGTGKYLEASDASSTQTQTIYGVWDNSWYNPSSGTPVLPLQRSSLLAQTITESGATRTVTTTGYTDANTDGVPDEEGWRLDLPTSKERLTGIPSVVNGILFFNTIIPSTSPCESGGTGWLMALAVSNGGMPEKVFDTNDDNTVDENDTATAGMKVGMSPGGSLVIRGSGGGLGVAVTNLTTGQLADPTGVDTGAGRAGRVTWREIIQ